ncbi:transcriptional regulator TrmB [Kribbella sandramycini]|uniref:DNA-binding NarL/FixJ family response regulator n=1 Tax=Kribbella sandramycini TaxID=60450 RepID=A0A7Y4L656_9ACTN|nr:helix-turn-helix domain-containing protein [Kribbella sandramycini]MBB6566066.1 DNA-binding NarL/FixJ family response regulator [Kribbella sandramycini]NOL45067.1 transcriptional regulator TrmB [Kribbella sandramycini]
MHNYRPAPVLEALGVCSEDEQLYRALLARPESTTTDLSVETGWPVTRVGRHLRSLLVLGLASRMPGRPARYVPAVPEAAVELLALRKQAAIVQARLGASVLTAEFRARHDAFTVIRGAEAVAQRFHQAQQAAQAEVLVLDRPPYVVVPLEARRAHGVTYRTIFDMASLSEPSDLVAARATGCRMLRDVPLKMLVADRRTALLPTSHDIVVELGPSTLLDGLLRLFDVLWHQATPLTPVPVDGPLTPEDQQLLSLAAAGLTDQAIARRLGVAQRTVERRMQRILKALDATTRFQAGLRAGQRGLLG